MTLDLEIDFVYDQAVNVQRGGVHVAGNNTGNINTGTVIDARGSRGGGQSSEALERSFRISTIE